MKKLFVLLFVVLSFQIVKAEMYEVKSGDTLYGILSNTFSPQEMVEINSQIKKEYKGFVLKPGMKIALDNDKVTLYAAVDKDIIIEKQPDGIAKVSINTYEQEIMKVVVKGTIMNNLFEAMYKAGEDAELAANLASIFEWEIDFLKDLRPGDRFLSLIHI